VCNVAIDHRSDVRLCASPGSERWVRLVVRMTGEDYRFAAAAPPGRHPIIEHAIVMSAIQGSIEVDIADSVLAGSGLGTSASVMVALVSALAAAAGKPLDPGEGAALAHSYETVTGKQSGIQDHAAAAWGGISRLDVQYPIVRRELIVPPRAAAAQLSARLHTVYLGAPHASSALHDEVIAKFDAGHGEDELDRMRIAARAATDALRSGDLDAYGVALHDSHQAIESMHDGLVGEDAHRLAELAREHGARGWKVNGAGGQGGTMAVLGPQDHDADLAFRLAITQHAGWQLFDAAIGAPGVITEVSVMDGTDVTGLRPDLGDEGGGDE
jgi:D-glycero-alpha-D-manno-heptose-7-phosphate kinase